MHDSLVRAVTNSLTGGWSRYLDTIKNVIKGDEWCLLYLKLRRKEIF